MKHKYISFVFFIFLSIFALLSEAKSAWADELDISVTYAQAEGAVVARVELGIAAPYHAYSHSPGDTGKPTVLTILPIAGTAGAADVRALVRYPQGILQADVFAPSQMVRVYEGRVGLFVDLPKARAGQEFMGSVSALLCSDKHCLPVQKRFTLRVPDAALPALQTLPWASDYAAAQLETRTAGQPETGARSGVGTGTEKGTGASLELSSVPFPSARGSGQDSVEQTGSALTIIPLPKGKVQANPVQELNPRYFTQSNEVSGLAKALLLGLMAGLILNVMPCVLPVLTMKASAILLMGEGKQEERYRRFREHSLLFAAGIMTLFLFLAVVLGTAGMIWGQLFQNSWVILAMLSIVFLLGLSMLGVFTLPIIDLKAAQSSSPRLQAYFTGIIATLLATPCSGPLLGGVLGWAFTQPLPILVTVFLAVGLGMSTPYLLFAFRPQLVTVLPKPGAWMGVLEKLLGFFLLGTSVYLLSILPEKLYIPVISLLLVLALCAWLHGRYASYDAPPRRRRIIGLASVLGIALAAYLALWPSDTVSRWENYSPAAFTEMLGREPMLVEFTADWCPNCKLLEQSTLTPKNLQGWQQQYKLRLIRVDLTHEDAAAQQLLQALGSSSIPLTALFPAGAGAKSPLVLRDIYTPATMDEALKQLFSQENELSPYSK